MSEKYCELIYNKILKIVYGVVGDKTTYADQLYNAGKLYLGDSFHGVYASDQIPKLTNKQPYIILNLDRSDQSGSHWISIAKIGKDIWVYDSFGRPSKKIISSLYKSGNGRIRDTDDDAEQKIIETDCGARSLAWLIMVENFGIDKSNKI